MTFNIIQHVQQPTHRKGHILDMVLTNQAEELVHDITVCDPGLCDNKSQLAGDHLAVTFTINTAKPALKTSQVTYRKLKAINIEAFKEDLASMLHIKASDDDLDKLVTTYESLCDLVDKHAPLKQKTLALHPHAPWFSDKLQELKHEKHKLERRWRHSRLEVHRQIYRDKCIEANKELLKTK